MQSTRMMSAQSKYVDATLLQPLLASYVRSSDAWKVTLDRNGRVLPSAPGYAIDESFRLPERELDESKMAKYLVGGYS